LGLLDHIFEPVIEDFRSLSNDIIRDSRDNRCLEGLQGGDDAFQFGKYLKKVPRVGVMQSPSSGLNEQFLLL
jgi:hypothetical protein